MMNGEEKSKCEWIALKCMVLSLVFSVLIWVSIWASVEPRNLFFNLQQDWNDGGEAEDRELLPRGFDKKSCVSRDELEHYRRRSPHKPSPSLISRLRSYEARHKKCGPYTLSYNRTLKHLHNSTGIAMEDCKYILWLPCAGLGNRMLTLVSAFLYALLTDRVLLAHGGADLSELFCEPFPETSFFLPLDFSLPNQFNTFNQESYVYFNIIDDYSLQDQLFFCDQDQMSLHNITWLIMKSDLYFVPSLFLMPSFQQELDSLFPEKETVFHFLGRYLFHPTNPVWGLVTRYYKSYLSKADVRVGIQVRVFDNTGPFTEEQLLSCTKREKILPQINQHPIDTTSSGAASRIAVVMASLRSSYFERVRDVYLENPTETREVVSVFQPSHEEFQQTEKASHNRKALAEVYLLSLTDKLVTSGWSTFGYVAQALGGLRPWIMYRPENQTVVPEPPCGRGMSMEPCFHSPPYLDCKMKSRMDPGGVVPHVRHCEDANQGIKLL